MKKDASKMIYDNSQILGRDEYSAGQELVRELNARKEFSRSYEIRLPHFVNDILKCGLGISGLENAGALEMAGWPRRYADDKWLYGATKTRFGRTLTDAEVKRMLLDGNDFSVPGDRYRAFVALNKLLGEVWCKEKEFGAVMETWDVRYSYLDGHEDMDANDESTWWTDIETTYEKAIEIAGGRWLKEFNVSEDGRYSCYAEFNDDLPLTYSNIWDNLYNGAWCVTMESDGRFHLRIPYRIRSTFRDDEEQDYTLFTGGEMQGCKHELSEKETKIKGVENSEGLRFSRGGLSLDAGTLIERTGGLIKLTQTGVGKDAYGRKTLEYKSKVLYPEFESNIGITMMKTKLRVDYTKDIIANGGTVPGYAG